MKYLVFSKIKYCGLLEAAVVAEEDGLREE